MKNLTLFLSVILLAACSPQNTTSSNNSSSKNSNNSNNQKTAIQTAQDDDGVWDLLVNDGQFDYFLNAIAQPMSMYSLGYLKSRNAMLVPEWNSYYYSGRYPDIIESPIDYDPSENYGLKFEYKLYQVFAYVQWRYGLRLDGLSETDVF